jgi:hypothetical protein
LGVAEELEKFLLRLIGGLKGLEHGFTHLAIGGFVLSGEQDGFGG